MSNTSSISGNVTTSNGEGLPGVVVTIQSDSLEENRTTVTDEQGHFSLRDLPSGQFMIMAVMTGFMDCKKYAAVKPEQDFLVSITMYSESEI